MSMSMAMDDANSMGSSSRALNTARAYTRMVVWAAILTFVLVSFFHENKLYKPTNYLSSPSLAQAQAALPAFIHQNPSSEHPLPALPPLSTLEQPPSDGRLPPAAAAPTFNWEVSDAGTSNLSSNIISSTNDASSDDQITVIQRKKRRRQMDENLRKLQIIEGGLAQARAAIQQAALTRNYTAPIGVQPTPFLPDQGRVYRNPYAFYRSHMEMVKRFKVWTYTEGEPPLFHGGPCKNIYGMDGQFMHEMKGGMSTFTARHPDEAYAFFLPWSVVDVVQYLLTPVVSYSRGPMHRLVLDYAHLVSRRYPFFNRSSGADHFMLSCHDWAPDVTKADTELFKDVMRALCNANMSEGFRPETDISIPETNIPSNGQLMPPSLGVRPSMRRILASFAGREHGHVRQLLFEHWKEKDDEIQVHEKLPRHANYFKMLGESRFCLCPSGYEVASPRIVEAIQAECVPVLISDNYSFPFNDVLNWNEFSVHIPVARIPEIKKILKGISTRRYLKLWKGVTSVKWHFTLNRPAKPFDMIHMILHSVWLRRLNIKLLPRLLPMI